jgi:DNA polymerase III delta prime subunit
MYPLHHALLYIGVDSFDVEHFSKQQKSTNDIIVQRYNEFRINDARQLIALATQTPVHQSRQCFVVIANSIAVEAQNALLKLLEEPPAVSSFVFVLPQNTLLPTIRSRFMIMSSKAKEVDLPAIFADFVSEAIPARLSRIATVVEKKDVTTFGVMRDGLIQYLAKKKRGLTVLQVTRLHWLVIQMQLRGASLKMLWEDVAFTIPVEEV